MVPYRFNRCVIFSLLASVNLWTAYSASVFSAAPLALESTQGMVVTAQHEASDVGAAILRQGGNAIDAAVAVGYALAVTHPCCGNLGGGGFMTIHLADGRNTFINFREKAPQAASANMYLDAAGNPVSTKSLDGYLAVGVPGTVMGLETARQKYGTLPRETLMAPAIRLADAGLRRDARRCRPARGCHPAISRAAQHCRDFSQAWRGAGAG